MRKQLIPLVLFSAAELFTHALSFYKVSLISAIVAHLIFSIRSCESVICSIHILICPALCTGSLLCNLEAPISLYLGRKELSTPAESSFVLSVFSYHQRTQSTTIHISDRYWSSLSHYGIGHRPAFFSRNEPLSRVCGPGQHTCWLTDWMILFVGLERLYRQEE